MMTIIITPADVTPVYKQEFRINIIVFKLIFLHGLRFSLLILASYVIESLVLNMSLFITSHRVRSCRTTIRSSFAPQQMIHKSAICNLSPLYI